MFRTTQARLSLSVAALSLSGSLLLSRPVLCQSAAQTSQPSPADSQAADAVPTIRTYTNLVVVDIVVTDSKGNPVHGLTPSDFKLTENNKPQLIRHFEEHSAVSAGDGTVIPAPKLPPGLFTNKSAAPASGPVNVLLLDYLNTPLSAQAAAKGQLIAYLNHAPAGTRIAIFALTNRLLMMQGFTSDMEVLKAALTAKKGSPQVSDLLTDAINGGPNANDAISTAITENPIAVQEIITPEVLDAINRFEAAANSFQQDTRAKYTLNAFDLLARYLIGIPGRKNVIWFSAGFPLNIEPDVNLSDPSATIVRNDDEVRKTDNLLTRAQVAVYPVDARGLMVDPSLNFSSGEPASGDAPTTQANWLTEVAQEHLTMEAMAEDTGGKPLYNTNGLTQAVQKAIDNGSNYYTLSYSPTNTSWDERFRSIKIRIPERSGLNLNYRNGYYAVDPNGRSQRVAGLAATAAAPPTTMVTAMLHGGPDPAEILLKVRIRPSAAPPQSEVLKSNQVNPDPKVKVTGPYREYGLDLVPDPRAVNCSLDEKGIRHCAIEVWTFVYNSDGEKLVTASNRLHVSLSPQDYARLLSGGMAFHQAVSVPVKGHYYLRTAIHDLVSDRVGAVEIPVAAVAHLEPLKPLPAVPTASEQVLPPAGAVSAPAPAQGSAPLQPQAR